MAALQIGESLELDDPKRVSIDLLVQNGLTKGVIKRVVADNADDEWRIRRGKCVGWPLDRFSEVINKGGFELKFRRGGLLRPGRWAIEEGRQQKEQMAKAFFPPPRGYFRSWGINGPPAHEARSADFQSAVSPISNRQPCESSCALYYSKVSQAGSHAIQQIGNLRYSGEAVMPMAAP